MAVRQDTLRLMAAMRRLVDAAVSEADAALVQAWARAWAVAESEWEDAAYALIAASKDGKWPPPGVIAREEKAQRALAVTRVLLDDLAQRTKTEAVRAAQSALDIATTVRAEIVASQYPAAARAAAVTGFGPVDARQVQAIINRTTQQITAATWPLGADATEAVRQQLVRGVLIGANPRETAARMVAQVNGSFDGGLTRALVISRTETLDAHRAGGSAWDKANTEVLQGWQWHAELDKRTCPACWAMHGSEHPIDEPGPDDHQQGRCARLPLTKSWKDLGFDIPEPASVVRDSQAVFNALPEADQLAVMGPQRLQLLRSGDAQWQDLARERATPEWRRSFAPTPVGDLAGRVA